jgi:hypothetical protein
MLFSVIIAIGILAVASDICIYTGEGFDHSHPSPIRLDGMGYFAYLPSLFIYHDISLYSYYESINNFYHFHALMDYSSMQANSNKIGPNETFRFFDLGNHMVAFQASNGLYLAAMDQPGREVLALGDQNYAFSEPFKLFNLSNSNVALQAPDGQYICADGGGGGKILDNSNSISDWEIFKLIDLGNNNIALSAHNGQYISSKTKGGIDRYPMGTAILIAPFFFAADLITIAANQPRDGISLLYQASVCLAGIFYLLFGLVLTYRLLLLYYPERIALIALPLLTFGTSLFYYATYETSFSHVYSFFLVAAFLYSLYRPSHSWLETVLLPAILLGLIALNRMPNVAIGMFLIFRELSFVGQERPPAFQLVKRWTVMFIAFSTVISLQFIYYYINIGKFTIWAYEGEAFNWLSPQVLNVLFYPFKGLFFCFPILLLSLIGILFISHYARHLFLPIILFNLVYLYIVSSWWCWDYTTFGMRPYVDIVAVLALPFSAAVDHFSNSRYSYILWSFAIAATTLTCLNVHLDWLGLWPGSECGTAISDCGPISLDGRWLRIYYDLVKNILWL